MKYCSIFLLLFLVTLSNSYPQSEIYFTSSQDENSVAKVGPLNITSREFQERYEFTPIAGKHVKKMENSLKLEFLYTIIAEKLWAMEAVERGLDTSEVIKFASDQFENMFIRDELYNREIKDKIIISDEEKLEGLKRNNTKLKVNFLFSTTRDEIFDLYKLLNEGIPFDSILVESPEYEEQQEPIEVVYGQMEESIEDSLYRLKLNEYTEPMQTEDGWYIFRVVNQVKNIMMTGEAMANAKAEVINVIEARKTNTIYNNFFNKFFGDKAIEVDRELFRKLTEKIAEIFKEKNKNYHLEQNNLIHLTSGDVLKIESEFGEDTLKLPYIKLNKAPISLKRFIRILAFDGFNSKTAELNSIRSLINQKNRMVIERELLGKEGLKRGYNLLTDVQNDVNMWRENYLYQLLQSQFMDSVTVTDEEAYQEYKKTNQSEELPPMVNIIELLTDSTEVVEMVMNKIDEGVDFKELAAKYTQRAETKNNGGEFGFFSITDHGELGRIAGNMKIGEIYGPIKLPEGFSIFKLINKKDAEIVPPQPFEKVKSEIIKKNAAKKVRKKMNDFTLQLANKYGVKINPELLKSIDVMNVNSMAFRFLGFGGKVTAVPLVSPNVDWVDPWVDQHSINQ